MALAVDWTGKGQRSGDKFSYRLNSQMATQVKHIVGKALAYSVSVARDSAASATNYTSSVNTTLFAPFRPAACAALAAAPAGAPTIGSGCAR